MVREGQTVDGNPYEVDVWDATKVDVKNIPSNGTVGKPVQFDIDVSKAGSGNLEIVVNDGQVPCNVQRTGRRTFAATFIPHVPGKHSMLMTFNKEAVPGSPWNFMIADAPPPLQVDVVDRGTDLIPVNREAWFMVSVIGGQKTNIHARILSPTKKTLKTTLTEEGPGTYRVEYTPIDVGAHTVEVEYLGKPVSGCPFRVRTYDPSAIKVSKINPGLVGRPIIFTVDVKAAGEGQLEIMINNGTVPNNVEPLGNGAYQVTFVPTEAKVYSVDIKFNDYSLPNAPYSVNISDASNVNASGEGLELVPVNRVTSFNVTGATMSDVEVTVTSPSHRTINSQIRRTKGAYQVEYKPPEVGTYNIEVVYAGMSINNSPFTSKAYDAGAVVISDIPIGIVGKLVYFTVDVQQAGEGQVEIAVNNGTVKNTVERQSKGVYRVGFLPTTAEQHSVLVKFNGENVPGSPCKVQIIDASQIYAEGRGLQGVPINSMTEFNVYTSGLPRAEMLATITAPSGREVPNQMNPHGANQYKVEYKPTEVGPHNIEVTYADLQISGSPFTSRAYDRRAITVDSPTTGIVGKAVKFVVNVTTAGEGKLEIMVNNGAVPNSVRMMSRGIFEMTFVPSEARDHSVGITFNEEPVPGSSFTVAVVDASRVKASGHGLGLIPIDRPTWFEINSHGIGQHEATVKITSPSYKVVPNSVINNMDGTYNVEYVPKEVGLHNIEVQYAELAIPGSPFSSKAYDASAVKVSSIPDGIVGKPDMFTVDIRAAGEGDMEVLVDNGQVPVNMKQQSRGLYQVSFVPLDTHRHNVDITFNRDQVPGSPWSIKVVDASRVTARGSGLNLVPVNAMASFEIDTHNSGNEEVKVKVMGPGLKPVPASVISNSDGTYRVDYTPKIVGPHVIEVTYADLPIPQSPFTSKAYDIYAIIVRDIPNGIVGKPIAFMVDVTAAGEGQLEIMVNQGSVPIEVSKRSTGVFQVQFVPQEAKTHFVDMKFNGILLPASPWNVNVTDATKVVATGSGLEIIPIKKVATFDIDARKAGKAELQIKVMSPARKAIPIQVMDNHNGTYRVEYIPSIVGAYVINITHADQVIAGSPFRSSAYDINAIMVSRMPRGIIGKPVEFTVDVTNAGEGQLETLINQGTVEHNIRLKSKGIFLISFIPTVARPHTVDIKYNEELVPGSTRIVEVTDASAVTVKGAGLDLVPINKLTWFEVTTNNAGAGIVAVKISSPTRLPVQNEIVDIKDGTYKVEYIPNEVGTYSYEVTYADLLVPGNPFTCKVYDTSAIRVSPIPDGILAMPVAFTVDVSEAGEGQLEIMVQNGDVPNVVKLQSRGVFLVTFIPETTDIHIIDIIFNGEVVLGSPFQCRVIDTSNVLVNTEEVRIAPVNMLCRFEIDPRGTPAAEVIVTVTDPTGDNLDTVVGIRGDIYIGEFTPKVVGGHVVAVTYGGANVIGSPFTCQVFDVTKVKVINVDFTGFLKKDMHFTVDASEAGYGDIDAEVTSPMGNLVRSSRDSIGNNKHLFSYNPNEPGDHSIDVTFNYLKVPACPIPTRVLDGSLVFATGEGLELFPVGKDVNFLVDATSFGPAQLDIRISAPSGKEVPNQIINNGDNTFEVEYQCNEVGVHRIDAQYARMAIQASPFSVRAYDARKVRVFDFTTPSLLMEQSTFIVDASEAGEGNLEIKVRSGDQLVPHEVEKISNAQSQYKVSFVPKEVKTHYADVSYNTDLVPGSAFPIEVQDPIIIMASGAGLGLVACNKVASFIVSAVGARTGDVDVGITSPSGNQVQVRLKDNGDGSYTIEWVPTMVGDHRIVVMYRGMQIDSGVFTARAYDPNKVTVSNLGHGKIGKPAYFNIDASKAGAGNLEIIVSVNGENVPNFVQAEGNARFQVSFTPQMADTHMISVKFNNEQVQGSPFACNVVDGHRCIASGDGIRLTSVNKLATFTVDPQGAGKADLVAEVTSPNGYKVPVQISGNSSSSFRAEYTPTEVGQHKVSVKYAEVDISGSPFYPYVYDVNQVNVSKMSRGFAGQPVTIEVETSKAGEGTLRSEVLCKGTLVHSYIQNTGPGKYEVTFTPKENEAHIVNLTFNDQHIKGSPFKIDIIDTSKVAVSGDGIRMASVNKEISFEIDPHGTPEAEIDVKVTSPTGRLVPCRVNRRGNLYVVSFLPTEVGGHVISVTYATVNIHGSPFTCQVYDTSKVSIVDVDQQGDIGREMGFTVDASQSGQGDIDVEVITPTGNLCRTQRTQLGNNRHRFTYTPKEPGNYNIEVMFNYEKLAGTPLRVYVAGQLEETYSQQRVVRETYVTQAVSQVDPGSITIANRSLRNASVDRLCWFVIEMHGLQAAPEDLQVIVRAPNGEVVPAKIVRQHDGDYKVEYSSQYVGRHIVDILYGGNNISGSPFYVDIYDPNRITVEGIEDSTVGEETGFDIHHSDAGHADLKIKIESPSGRVIPHRLATFGSSQKVTYTPSEAGLHRIYINYGGIDIPGCPLNQNVTDASMITASGDGLYRGEEDKPATFFVNTHGSRGSLSVSVDGPNSIAKCNIGQERDRYVVTYVPVEVGLFDATIKWNDREIPGSPFHPKVFDARKVHVTGGWQSLLDANNRIALKVGEEKHISFDTQEAGPGKLTAEVNGPDGGVPCSVTDRPDGRVSVSFIPRIQGEHYVKVMWADIPLPKSPLQGYAQPASSPVDHTKVILTGRGLKEASVSEEAEFIIDGSQAGPGKPIVTLEGTSSNPPVNVQSLGAGRYRCTYRADNPGAYLLNIKWSEHRVHGSPFKVSVNSLSDATKVLASGDGLKMGIMGQQIRSQIDTRRAGPGQLTAHCTGPTKVAYCELYDHRDGLFTLNVKPQEAGKHTLQVKYDDVHIPGSPYTLRISGAPDASKVRVTGPGIEHGILAKYQSRFIVETRGAGAGQLTVRIRGPKGAFHVEMQRESQKDRTILCHYDPAEIGDYVVSIKWSGVHVPGSPFNVNIFDTEEELQRFYEETGARRSAVQHRAWNAEM
ncbi:unnamed protein product [Owenia fusiformis]|uniref:Uncharacterized protein n=1 Tax=Owenia fusiformis TaxID=6347 RepID=A0A8J1V129_OWEFU|nr:unnamed protein product [Owenia fusiformis]